MAPTIISTQRASANILQVRRTIDVQRDIEITNPSDIPFVQLLRQLRKRPIMDSKVRWIEDEYLPQTSAIVTDNSATTDTIVVTATEGGFFNVGDIITNTVTGEFMRVTAVVGDELSLTRGYGSTSESVGSASDEIFNIGPAVAEGAAAPAQRTTVAVEKFNFLQTFRKSYSLTDELGRDLTLLTEDDLQYQRRKNLEEHLIRLEKHLFFGERNEDVGATDAPIRSMGGARFFITNQDDAGGTLTETFFKTFLKNGFRRGSKEKWLFASPTVTQAISNFATSALRVRPEDETFGIAVTDYIVPGGLVHIVMHRLFTESVEFEKFAFLLDMNKIWLRMAQDTNRRENIQNPDELLIREEYVTKLTIEFRNEEAHRILKGVTG